MLEKPSCIVVGAGMAGLVAADQLQTDGWQVTILDKGRGVGGRMASRRVGDARFDHGAQYFTVRDPRFQALVDQWLADGVSVVWANGFTKHDENTSGGSHPRYRGVDGMTAMAKAIAAQLNVHTSTKVTAVNITNNRWNLTAAHLGTDAETVHTADALLMTPPAEQSLILMRSGNVTLPADVSTALERIAFNPCFAVLVQLDAPSNVPKPGGVFMPGEPLSWIADNQQKGISTTPAVTLHAGPAYTRDHYDNDPDAVAHELIAAAREVIGPAQVVGFQVQRWRYSQPSVMHPEKTLFRAVPAPLAFAGDAFDGAKVEGAALSGMAAADALKTHFADA